MLKPSYPPARLGIACGANVPSKAVLSGGASWAISVGELSRRRALASRKACRVMEIPGGAR
jgi:hypothetical protein